MPKEKKYFANIITYAVNTGGDRKEQNQIALISEGAPYVNLAAADMALARAIGWDAEKAISFESVRAILFMRIGKDT